MDGVSKIDDGHKWKYYELTKKGAGIVSPRQGGTRVMLILSLSLVAFVASMFMLLMPAMPDAQTAPLMAEAPMASKNGEVLVGGEQPYGAMEYIPTAMPAERWDDGEYYDAVMDVEGADAGVDSEAPPPAEPVPESGMSDETTTGDGGAEAAQAIHAEEPEAQSAEKKSEVPLPLVIAILSLATILLSVYELSRSGR